VIERTHLRALLALAAVTVAVAGCGSDNKSDTGAAADTTAATTATTAQAPTNPALSKKPKVKVPSGPAPRQLMVNDLIKGSGPEAAVGDMLTVKYVGVRYRDGKQFDASWDRGQSFPLQLGTGSVIPGWDQGLVGMQAGGRRELIIPPDLAYGPQGQPPDIGPNETLVFVIDLEKIG
jgi:peptidylprolyl isomerase